MSGDENPMEALPVAVYTTDATGRLTFFNSAAADLWGRRPDLERTYYCGAHHLFWRDGRIMRREESAVAVCLREGRPLRDLEAICERPDGSRVPFSSSASPLRDASGRITGAVGTLLDASGDPDRRIESERLAAIVEGSDDAIVSKTLDGVITSWNHGAERIFGYAAEEIIGSRITRIIPPELHDEEERIIASLVRGEGVKHFDTERIAKDGRRVQVSLTISPLRDHEGRIVGASKIARDVTERKAAEELQRLLFEELNHRVKNTLATIQAIAGLSLRRSTSPGAFVESFNGRVQALARAHDLLVRGKLRGTTVGELVRGQVLPPEDRRISISGPEVVIGASAAVNLGLVLHELATNAVRHGALAVPQGKLAIQWRVLRSNDQQLVLSWQENNVPIVIAPEGQGFGTSLIQRMLTGSGGEATLRYEADGVRCELRLPLPEDDSSVPGAADGAEGHSARGCKGESGSSMYGKRILLIEDEALVAMEIEADLQAAGCEVIGPAANVVSAKQLIEESEIDAALVDANLAGRPVDDLAAALAAKGVPFAFATGYGRDGLPAAFREALVLTKPFSREQMLSTVRRLLAESDEASNVVPLKR